jgi:hypothetical protein
MQAIILPLKFQQMKTITLAFIFLLTISSILAQDKAIMTRGRLLKDIASLKELKPVDEKTLVQAFDKDGKRIWPQGKPLPKPVVSEEAPPETFEDPLLQKNVTTAATVNTLSRLTGPIVGIEAQTSSSQVYDPTVCVGNNHVIQLINGPAGAQMKIWNKSGGVVTESISLQALSGLPGNGDPIALYDQLSDRYILTQFIIANGTNRPNGMAILVSKTGDPTLGWFSYIWSIPENILLDYPKWAVGPTGLFLHTNNFPLPAANDYRNSFFVAFNKDELYAGNASFRSLRITQNIGNAFSTCPAQVQGSGVPSGGQVFVAAQDGGRIFSFVTLIECNANWAVNTFIQTKLGDFSVPFFSGNICSASEEACVQQPGTTVRVETLTRRVMNQPIMRILPDGSTGMVTCFTVNAGNNRAGIRWMEFRRTGTSWRIAQQATWHPNGNHQFLGSIAYDAEGNIGLAYNTGGSSVPLSIRYTGRKACDPLNQMTLPETSLREGNGFTSSNRWGDYNHLVADPDGQSLWMTAMYARFDAEGQRASYVSRFGLPSCNTGGGGGACAAPTGLTGLPDCGEAYVSWTAVPGAISYTVEFKRNTATTWMIAEAGTGATEAYLFGAGGAYNWRVRANCDGAVSAFAESVVTIHNPSAPICTQLRAQRTPAVGEAQGVKNTLRFSPQPANGRVTLSFDAAKAGTATLTIVAPDGVTVMQQSLSPQAGFNQVNLNIGKLTAGIYLVQLRMAGEVRSSKLVVK